VSPPDPHFNVAWKNREKAGSCGLGALGVLGTARRRLLA
jgi:hypothetical protein